MTELELLHKIKSNPDAFSEVFKLYYKSIFGYILRRTGDFDDSADIAANTFFKAFNHINNFSYKGISVKVWLYRIATNEVNQFFRHSQKHNSLFKRFDFINKKEFSNYLQQDKDELEAELQKHSQFLTILKALKALPNKYQEVIKELTDKISYIRELLSSKQIEPEDFREMKSDYNSRIEKLEAKLSGLQHDDINIKDLLNKGIDNLLRLDQVYETADIDKKREVISSIFPEKFHFENNSLRTERVNEAVMYIYKINSNLDQKKRGQNKSDSVLSSQVGMTR